MKFHMRKPSLKVTIEFNHAIYLCVALSCFVPRYISTFKIHVGIYLSYYTIVVAILWLLSTRHIRIEKKIDSSFFYIWFFFILASVWRASNFGIWAFYLDWILTAILLRQIIIKHQDENTFEYIVRALTDALFIHLLIGLYEITFHRYLFQIGNVARTSYGHVAIGMFYNLNDYATFVTTMIPFAIYRFLASHRFKEKLYCSFLTLTSLYLIIINGSRGAILTLMIFVFWGIIIFARKNARNLLIAGVCICIIGVMAILNVGGLYTTLINLVRNNSIDINKTDIARINLIKNGLYFLKKTHGFGVGAGNLYSWLAEKAVYSIGELRFIHNWYVEVLVTFGILFFVIYIYFHSRILYKCYSKNYGTGQLKTTFFLSFVCFSVVSISSSSNIYSEWVWMYLVIISLFSESLKRIDSIDKDTVKAYEQYNEV